MRRELTARTVIVQLLLKHSPYKFTLTANGTPKKLVWHPFGTYRKEDYTANWRKLYYMSLFSLDLSLSNC